ncbi:MAG: hypothetical protein ACOX19_07530 [Fermentimonas sp.]
MKINRTIKILATLFLLLAAYALQGQELSDLKNAKPLDISGSIGLTSSFYNVSGIPERQAPFAYGINANATLTVYGISMPFSFTWFNNNKKGNFSQPFNQFGISPTYKWLTVHLGYRNLSFSEFTLNGYTFLGAGVEAKPGKFRLGAVYGKFNQNSTFNLAMADSIPKMTRMGWATKVGYGTDNRFVDLSVLRIGDDPKNFDPSKIKAGGGTPEQNIAFGLTSRFEIIPQLMFTFDGSYSFYTNDRTVAESDSIGDSMLKFAGNFITVNNTSAYFKAFKTGLNYRFTPTIVSGIEFRRVDPGFRSMGSYFFNNDVQHVTFNQTLGLLENKLNLRGSLGIQSDNLNGEKANTAKRVIGSLSGSYNIDQNWGIDGSFSNFSTNQQAYRQSVTDTLRIFQVNRTISLSPRYMKATEKLSHMVMLNLNMSTLDDKNKHTADMTDTDTYMAMLMYNLGLPALRMNVSAGLNYTMMTNKHFENVLAGGNLNVSKTFLEDKLSLNWGNNVMSNTINDDSGLIINSALNAAYRFHPKHSLSLNFNVINNRFAEGATVPSYNEIRGDIGYVFTF